MREHRREGMRWVSSLRPPAAAVAALLGATLACSDLTSVDTPGVTQPADVATPDGAVSQFNGAVGAFAIALGSYVGSATAANTQIVTSGLLSDELGNTSSGTDFQSIDSRNVSDPASVTSGPYANLHTARVNALIAARGLQQFAPTPGSRIGELYAYVGYTDLFFAETFCSGLTLATVTADGPTAYGTPLTTSQMLQQAAAAFDSATQFAADSARILNLALIGKGRALLNLGDFAGAAAAVAPVPPSYTFATANSAQLQPNALGALFSARNVTVSDREGTNGLDFVSANDPRVPTTAAGVNGLGLAVVVWNTVSGPAALNVLGSGIEARLIVAEAALHTGNVATWLNELNALRTDGTQSGPGAWNPGTGGVAGLAPLTDPGTPDARVDLMFRERAFWLYGTGHRLGDLRRLIRQYARTQNQVFPIGQYSGGQFYGSAVNMTPDQFARNNPNFKGCLDRGA